MGLAAQLPDDAVVTRGRAADWREAIRLAGRALSATGVATDAYTDEMIAAVEKHGPYIVVAPGFALAHARPSPAVLRTGISWVSLAEPVEFGSDVNDPVRLVVGLAAVDHDAHLQTMAELAGVLADEELLEALIAAPTPAAVRELLSAGSSNREEEETT
ncbi:PTS sugar transporter subunit IIA [Microbacterium album]|uniref:Ascorbate-specific PTS system EIIA component n=1 Tax=Microbacterium album TaxID=2053191 RepID=A0A917IE47_9MICO|nr:PTS sugar transporter subunit IIA [Microbacterium album]GGH37237.1 PTS ascorbate transporter subunit IIA [Microbacterium album]